MEAHHYDEVYRNERDSLADVLEDAFRAARLGRTDELEFHLTRLRRISGIQLEGLRDELYGMARSVQQHPSYRPDAPGVQAEAV